MLQGVTVQLNHSRVNELNFTKSTDLNDQDENNFSLEVGVSFPENSDEKDEANKTFVVTLRSDFQIKEGFIFKVSYQSFFTTNVEISDEFKKSTFPKVNAPAIAFPFYRAFIANFLLNSGFEPILLPSVNFVELHKRSLKI